MTATAGDERPIAVAPEDLQAPTRRTLFSYVVGNLANTSLPAVLLAWVLYFYSPPEGQVLLSATMVGFLRAGERILGWVIDPVVGHLSDRTRSRFGRRIPWIALGAPLLCITFLAIWFPPRDRPTDDLWVAVHFAVCITLFWAAYSAVVAPFFALLPELDHRPEGRLRLSLWLAVCEVISNVATNIGVGYLISAGGLVVLGFALDDGFQVVGVLGAGFAFLTYTIVIFGVREPPRGPAHDVQLPFLEAARRCFDNPSFLPYAAGVGAFRFAATSVIIGIPFVATVLMRTDEGTAGLVLALITGIALLSFPLVQRLALRFGNARVFAWGGLGLAALLPLLGTIGLVPVLPPGAHGLILFTIAGFSVATYFVLPRALLAEVIDEDLARTGLRREAMYNGMSGIVEKAGEAAALAMIGLLFDQLGKSPERDLGLRLLGLFAAGGLLMGMLAFRRYRSRK